MSIYYSKQVLKGLNEYKKALVSYPILKERAIRKKTLILQKILQL